MAQLVQTMVNGISLGCVYALVALAFVIVYEATGVVNFATGQFVMVGAFLAVSTIVQADMAFSTGYFVTLLGMLMFGLLFNMLIYRPLRKQPVINIIIGTLFVSVILQNSALLIWGSGAVRPPSPLSGQEFIIAGVNFTAHSILVIGVTVLLMAGLYLFLYRSSLGGQMRAVAQDPEAARLMGISASRVFMLAWTIAALLTGVAGILLGPVWFADVNMGDPLALKAFAATIIGGFGSVPGAVLGGVFVGLAEALGISYISSAYKDALIFMLMILFLLFRPQGILGEKIRERA